MNKGNNDQIDALPDYSPPNISDAARFRLSTLPRRLRDPSQPSGFRLASLGEEKDQYGNIALHYPLFSSGTDVLNEFGVGVSLYFKTLKALFVLLFICAFISLTAMYQNRKFNPDQDDIDKMNALFGQNKDIEPTPTQLIGSVYGAERKDLSFGDQGASDIVCCVLICLFALFGGYLEDKVVTKIDVSQQTSQDYSVVVTNPPEDVNDPEEYFKFFSKFGDVVLVTIAINNGSLITALAQRKALQDKVQGMVLQQEGMSNIVVDRNSNITGDKIEENLTLSQKLGFSPTIKGTFDEIAKVTKKIVGLSNQTFHPWKVFVTFNKEAEQRECIKEMSTGKLGIFSNPKSLFHKKHLLVKEATEPSSIIYANSHVTYIKRIISWIFSYFLSGCLMVASFFIIRALSTSGNVGVAIFVSLVNSILPETLKYITQSVEIHVDVRHFQISMLLKLVAARCINSALLIYLATKFENTFGLDSLYQMQNILIADAITTPLFRLLNVYDYFVRYIYAPRISKTQEELDSYWQGADWTLAERYTDVLKTIFVGLFFLVPLPSGLFITAFAMLTTYCVDKYSLLRIWKRPPQIDKTLGQVSRYFYIGIVFCHLSISRIYFANWPYTGLWGFDTHEKARCTFFKCYTDDNMTDDQKKVVNFYSGACISMFVVVIAWIVAYNFVKYVKKGIFGSKKTVGRASSIAFRHVSGIQAYVPVVNRSEFVTPLICADVSNIPLHHLPINFGSAERETFTVYKVDEFENMTNTELLKPLFSKVKFFADSSGNTDAQGLDTGLPTAKSFINTAPAAFASSPSREQQTSAPTFVQHSNQPQYTPNYAPVPTNSNLPPGWEIRYTPEGRLYYVDHNTKLTHWELPAGIMQQQNHQQQQQFIPQQILPQNTSQEQLLSQQQSNYSVNSNQYSPNTIIPMNVSYQQQYHQPSHFGGPTYLAPVRPSRQQNLPYGWEIKFTANGKQYYVDHNTHTTHWALPM